MRTIGTTDRDVWRELNFGVKICTLEQKKLFRSGWRKSVSRIELSHSAEHTAASHSPHTRIHTVCPHTGTYRTSSAHAQTQSVSFKNRMYEQKCTSEKSMSALTIFHSGTRSTSISAGTYLYTQERYTPEVGNGFFQIKYL